MATVIFDDLWLNLREGVKVESFIEELENFIKTFIPEEERDGDHFGYQFSVEE